MSESIISAKNIYKKYSVGSGELEILKGIDFSIKAGEAQCIVGGSGAGKSTLLHILGGLDKPTSGDVTFKEELIYNYSDAGLSAFRNKNIGFVFQFHHLLAEFTAVENVLMPARIAGMDKDEAQKKAEELLEDFGMSGRAGHYPSQLSGGEQQRVAIARSLIMDPEVLMADEPTGNLDSANAGKIHDLFFELQEKRKLTLIVVTHEESFAARFPHRKTIKDGQWLDL